MDHLHSTEFLISSTTSSAPVDPTFKRGTLELHDSTSYPHCPIFIPSKGRHDQERGTLATLIRDLVPFTVVVEPGEAGSYSGMIDHLVFEFFGIQGMVHTLGEYDDGDRACVRATPPSSTHDDLLLDRKDEQNSNTGMGDKSAARQTRCACCHNLTLEEEAAWPFAKRIAQLYHHGYVFHPLTKSKGASGCPPSTEATVDVKTHSASAAFTLFDTDAVRSLFKVAVLPEANRGVSYVRNYILQVLVPQAMVGSGIDRGGNIEELGLFSYSLSSTGLLTNAMPPASDANKVFLHESTLRSFQLDPSVYEAIERLQGTSTQASRAQASVGPPHSLYGYYWVMDDDVYAFMHANVLEKRNEQISTREMMRRVEQRIQALRCNAADPCLPKVDGSEDGFGGSSSSLSRTNLKAPIFTCKEDAMINNFQSVRRLALVSNGSGGMDTDTNFTPSGNGSEGAGKSTILNTNNYPYLRLTACFSLEYNCFAYQYDDAAIAVNSYNNIACLFDYRLLHNPMQTTYFPPYVTSGVRGVKETLEYIPYECNGWSENAATGKEQPTQRQVQVTEKPMQSCYCMPGSMMWYRFAVREDYDFSLQLIARGMYTLRFRNLSFDVPQMAKLRGGMTEYYKNCMEDICIQNNRFAAQWPAVAQMSMKGRNATERNDMRVRWYLLHPSRVPHPGAFLFLKDPLILHRRSRSALHNGSDFSTAATQASAMGSGPQHVRGMKRCRNSVSSDSGDDSFSGEGTASSSELQLPASLQPPVASLKLDISPAKLETTMRPEPNSRWKGYAVERWRDLKPSEASALGLQLIPSENLHVGQTVAIVPPLFSQTPSVVLATLIEKQSIGGDTGSGGVRWTAVAQNARDIPLLTVSQCYEVPLQGLTQAAAAVDYFFSNLKLEGPTQASMQPTFLDD